MSTFDYIGDPDPPQHTGFLLAEEAALKQYLSGRQAPSGRNGDLKDVPVYFRWPDSTRRITYPYITIDLLNISPAYGRWTSLFNEADTPAEFIDDSTGAVRYGQYYPSESYDVATDPEKTYYIERFLPYNLMFQISVWSRSIQVDRYLQGRFMVDIFPPRSFFIGVEADHVWRRCELLEWVSADSLETTEADKRILRKIYTIVLETEIPTSKVLEVGKIRKIHVDIYDKDADFTLAPGHPSDSPAHSEIAESFTTVAPPSGT